ncbi:MAG: hypothetical protein AMK69_12400 [Nitrospira bacterium SG8_3]|jgi:hypothetical protein|nr:MAG: hypothetical protein AMK69_12400 [Nitrospira bacterium SG8_3]
MSKVVDLQAYRVKSVEQRSFRLWCERFGESYGIKTRLAGLSDRTLYFLALPGEQTAVAYYELIMGILGFGEAPKFYYLPNTDQMMIVDIHLFVADQVRLEMMRRLGWLTSFAAQGYTLFEIVQAFEKIRAQCKEKPPTLSEAQPDFGLYNTLMHGDKEVYLRRKLREALETFRARLAT